jgi:hypothetical protein
LQVEFCGFFSRITFPEHFAMRGLFLTVLALFLSPLTLAQLERSPAPEGAEVYFIAPEDGAQLSGEFTVRFGLRKMGVAPAGVMLDNTGHHHLLVDVDIETLDMTRPLPASAQVIHFGMGQTETQLLLEPGTYTLQLLLGNHMHIPHEPPVLSQTISVTVE